MIIIIIIFFTALLISFGLILYRAWEIRTQEQEPENLRKILPEVYFRHVEKIILFITKHIIQSIILIIVKYWYIFAAKIRKWGIKNLPKISTFFKIKRNESQRKSFLKRAIIESRIKIRRVKEKVKRELEEETRVE